MNNDTPNNTTPAHSNTDEAAKTIHPGLRDLRQKIKEVMIPLLVGVFEAKLSAQRLPSRLHGENGEPPEKIREQLEDLHKGVSELLLWCESCKKQIGKAIEEVSEGPKGAFPHVVSSTNPINPDVKKSFSDAISGRPPQSEKKEEPVSLPKLSWWKRPLDFILQFSRRLKNN